MTNQEMLEKAIKAAMHNGWQSLNSFAWNVHKSEIADDRWILCLPEHSSHSKVHLSIYEVIFSHDFAKALWGEIPHHMGTDEPAWKMHLRQMVIADDPIKYLGENI